MILLKIGDLYLSILSSILSIVAYILIIIQVKKNAKVEKGQLEIEHKKTKGFILGLLIFAIISSVVAGYFLRTFLERPTKHRIALLIPYDINQTTAPFDDGRKQFNGLYRLLKKHHSLTEEFHFIIRNHNMETDTAKSIVRDELKKGTEYFVCTMSHISICLSEEFPALVEKYSKYWAKPKLIITVSSSMKVKTKKNMIYRFYIRSKEEADKLIPAARKYLNSNQATFIAVKDSYGQGAVDEFKKEWTSKLGYTFMQGLNLGLKWDEHRIEKEIKNKLLPKIKDNQTMLIFVVHYANGLNKIFNSLKKYNIKREILATSTAADESLIKEFQDYLEDIDWITCVPEKIDGSISFSDVIEDFFYYTMHRLVRTISTAESDKISFHDAWIDCSEPKGIKYEFDEGDEKDPKADFIIKMVDYPQIRKRN